MCTAGADSSKCTLCNSNLYFNSTKYCVLPNQCDSGWKGFYLKIL